MMPTDEQQRLGVGDLRHDGVIRRRRPIDRRDEQLDEVAEARSRATKLPMISSIGRKPNLSNIKMP